MPVMFSCPKIARVGGMPCPYRALQGTMQAGRRRYRPAFCSTHTGYNALSRHQPSDRALSPDQIQFLTSRSIRKSLLGLVELCGSPGQLRHQIRRADRCHQGDAGRVDGKGKDRGPGNAGQRSTRGADGDRHLGYARRFSPGPPRAARSPTASHGPKPVASSPPSAMSPAPVSATSGSRRSRPTAGVFPPLSVASKGRRPPRSRRSRAPRRRRATTPAVARSESDERMAG